MKLDAATLLELGEIARTAALRAGALIAERRGDILETRIKSTGSSPASRIVTEVDRQSQAVILDILAPSVERHDLGLLAEESADDASRLEKDHFWCVDPLDGTLPYSEGKPGFAVSIALVARDGRPLIGVIHDPHVGTLYHGIHQAGAFKNERPFTPVPASPERFSLVVDQSFQTHHRYSARLAAITRLLKEHDYPEPHVVQAGGAVMNACHVLEHAPACYLKFPRKDPGGGSLWDYAATAAIFHESGAWATDANGKAMELNRPDSTFMNHRGVLFASDARIASVLLSAMDELDVDDPAGE